MERWVKAFINFGATAAAEMEIHEALKEIEELIKKYEGREFEIMLDAIVDSLDDQDSYYLALIEILQDITRPLKIVEVSLDPMSYQITDVIVVKQITQNGGFELWFDPDYTF